MTLTHHGTRGRGCSAALAGLLALTLVAACAPSAAPSAKSAAPADKPAAAAAPAGQPAAPAPQAAPASPPAPLPLRIAWASPSATMIPLWLAAEQGIFREQGLDVELVFLSSVRTDQGVITGDTPIGYGANVVATRLSGADIVAIASVASILSYTLYTQPSIRTPQDLRGKTVVSTQPGASNTMATTIVLRHFGLEPGRDVAVQPSPGGNEMLAMVSQGLADGGLFSPPADQHALALGLNPLVDMKERNIPFLLTGLGTTASYARQHAEEVRRFLRGYVLGVAAARRNADSAKTVLGKYTQTEDPAILESSYQYYRDLWARPDFRVPPEAIASVLSVLDAPGADTAKPEDFIDNRFVDELHASGFIRQAAPFD